MMSKNNFFDLHRFINLCRKEMVEGWKVNLLRMLLMYGALTVFFIFMGFNDYERATTLMKDPVVEGSLRVFLVAGCIYGCISASLIMERMKTKAGRFSFLMLPATSFEKYVARWLVFTVVFVVAYLVAFELADYTRVVVCSLSFPDVKGITPTSLRLLFLWNDGNEIVYQSASDVLISVCSYLFLQSFFVLGSTVWPKNAFLKTFATGLGLFFTFLFISTLLVKALVQGSTNVNWNFNLLDAENVYVASCIFFLLALFNWVLAYFRFKESEIINRM